MNATLRVFLLACLPGVALAQTGGAPPSGNKPQAPRAAPSTGGSTAPASPPPPAGAPPANQPPSEVPPPQRPGTVPPPAAGAPGNATGGDNAGAAGGRDPQRSLTDDALDEPAEPTDAGDDAEPTDDDPEPQPTGPADADPLAIPDDVRERIGATGDERYPGAVGPVHRKLGPYYEETRGDYRLRLLPPFMLEHTRGLPTPQRSGVASPDTEGLYGLLYYRRRSLKVDADVLFPLAWHLREEQTKTTVVGPFVHQESPKTHANWLAPLVFQGKREDGGYLHMPLLLTLSTWKKDSAFTLVGPYLRRRTGKSVDETLFPFLFRGDNHDEDGARRSYTLLPPLLFYTRYRELTDDRLTIAGPLYLGSNPKRSYSHFLPLVFHIQGKPETGGVRESHTTVFPFFHYGRSEQQSLFVLPGYLRRVTASADTLLTPLVSVASTRNGATQLVAAGPVLPLFMNYRDKDIGLRWTAALPFAFHLSSPKGYTFATPLFGVDRDYGVSSEHWVFPTIRWGTNTKGWHADVYPVWFSGRQERNKHTVLAPLYWDFASPESRTTIGFPFFWRFSAPQAGNVTQVVANTVYVERQVRGGSDWQFHFAPLFSYGKSPRGHFWNVLFGLTGYSRKGDDAYVRALWIPFQVDGKRKSREPAPKTDTASR